MTKKTSYKGMDDFYPYYLGEHHHPWTKVWHVFGTLVGIATIVVAIVYQIWWLIPVGLVVAYACAWLSHLLIEGNRPATLSHPFLSFISDLRMMLEIVTGRRPLRDKVSTGDDASTPDPEPKP